MENVLKVEGLTKQYKRFTLDHISFEVGKNSIVGFIGANGAGKTTTIKLILGLIHSKEGKVTYFNDEKSSINQKIIKDRIGVVLDEACFYENFSINQFKQLIAPLYSNWDEEVYINYLRQFELNPKARISSLSKGMKMKFSLALALSHHAELLIMDEPSSGLDPFLRKELNNILVQFTKNEGHSVFFSTHIISDLDRIADTIICIDHGKIKEFDSKNNLMNKYRQACINEESYLDKTREPNLEDIVLYLTRQGVN